jgi:hypothetical protein
LKYLSDDFITGRIEKHQLLSHSAEKSSRETTALSNTHTSSTLRKFLPARCLRSSAQKAIGEESASGMMI